MGCPLFEWFGNCHHPSRVLQYFAGVPCCAAPSPLPWTGPGNNNNNNNNTYLNTCLQVVSKSSLDVNMQQQNCWKIRKFAIRRLRNLYDVIKFVCSCVYSKPCDVIKFVCSCVYENSLINPSATTTITSSLKYRRREEASVGHRVRDWRLKQPS